MLSSEIATTLGGRFIIFEVYPYSFKEYLSSQNIELSKNWEFSNIKNRVVQHSQVYLKYGGLPEIIAIENKRPWLSGLYQKIFLGDILTRYSIRNDFALKLMIKKLAESVMHPISYNRLANTVSSAGSKTGVTTMIEYMKYVQSSWLIFGIPNYASVLQDKETLKKYYFTDNGILGLFLIEGYSILLENLVAITLWKKFGDKLFYYNRNIEVDFFIPEKEIAIQACYNISNENTLGREIDALRKLSKNVSLKKAIIVTNNEEKFIVLDEITIEIVPIWKWLTAVIN